MISALVWIAAGLLLVVAGIMARRRVRRARPDRTLELSDDMIRRIEEMGRLHLDIEEPLDLEDIRAREDEFWSETWDEPEPL